MTPQSDLLELQESNDQAIAAWRRFAKGAPNGEFREADGVTWTFAHVPLGFFNMAFLSRPVTDASDLNKRLVAAKGHAAKAGLPWMFFLCETWLPASVRESRSELFGNHGLHLAMPLKGMAADVSWSDSAPSASLHYQRVEGSQICSDAADMNCSAYGIPMALGRESILEGMFGADAFAFVGYLEGKPVTTAGVWVVDGLLYVAMVATHPDHRRKGYADAVMLHALGEAQKATGITRSVLHATEAGFGVYQRMGYKTVAPFALYAESHE